MIGKQFGQFRIVEKIGAGGMGEVYLARDENLERDVAVKILPHDRLTDDRARKSFREEALALSRLNHPNIATIHAFESVGDIDFLVMEHIEGPTLAQRIADSSLSEADVVRIGREVSMAVAEAHEHNIVHRDLKPGNIKLTRRGEAKVLDFGLATLLRDRPMPSDAALTQSLAQAPTVMGTIPYMPPEQLRGKPSEETGDVWALGVILHEAVVGQRPFQGETGYEISSAIISDPPAPLPMSVSTQLRAVIQRCLQKDPQQRYQNAGHVTAALDTIQSSSSEPVSMPRAEAPGRKRNIGIAAAVVVAVAAITAWLAFQGGGTGSTDADIQSVVALPSTVVGEMEDQYLADAVPRKLSNYLSEMEGLVTKKPPTSLEYQKWTDDPGELASTYDVSAHVISSITSQPGGLILNVQLVETDSERLLWGNDFSGSREDFLDLISQAAQGLQTALRPAEAAAATPPGSPRNPEAELACLRGLYHFDLFYGRGTPDDLQFASDAFEEAMALDPTLADAAASLAQVHLLEIALGGDPLAAMDRAEMWAQRALQQDATCSQAWQVLGAIETMRPDGDRDRALEHALKASAFDPRNNYAQIALAGTLAGTSCELAIAAYDEGPRLNPLDLNSSAAAAGLHHIMGREDEAVERLDRVLRIEPELPYALVIKTMVLAHVQRADEARAMLVHLESQPPGGPFPPQGLDVLRGLLALAESPDALERDEVRRLIELASGDGEMFPFWDRITQPVAPMLAGTGHAEEAIAVLEARVQKGVFEPYDLLLWNSSLELLRGDPRYQPVLEGSKTRFNHTLEVLEAARKRNELPWYLDEALADLEDRLASSSSG